MNKKICVRCRKEKLKSEFGILKKNPDGLRVICKICRNKSLIKYKDATKERNKSYYENNKEKFHEHYLLYYKQNKEIIKQQ
ncbi:MAG: hypothetical protein AABY22_04995 [Nanoarchaeota archaeon]